MRLRVLSAVALLALWAGGLWWFASGEEPAAPPVVEVVSGPPIELTPAEFATLPPADGGPVTLEGELANRTGRPLRVAVRSKSCSCMSVEIPRPLLEPRSRVPLRVVVRAEPGTHHQLVNLDIADPDGTPVGMATITYKATIVRPYQLDSDFVARVYREGEAFEEAVTVFHTPAAGAEPPATLPVAVEVAEPFVTVGPFERVADPKAGKRPLPGHAYAGRVRVKPAGLPSGDHASRVSLRTPDGRTHDVVLRLVRHLPFAVSPAELDAGTVPAGQSVERRVLVLPKEDFDPARLTVAGTSDAVAVRPAGPAGAGGPRAFVVTVRPKSGAPLRERLEFVLSGGPAETRVPVAVRAN